MENQTKTKLTLNPEEEKQSNILLEGTPVRQTVQPIVQTQTEYNAGSIDESMLSNDEKEMVAQFANEIDISNAKQVIQYGSSAQKSISDFSVNILGKVKTSELGDVGDALKEFLSFQVLLLWMQPQNLKRKEFLEYSKKLKRA